MKRILRFTSIIIAFALAPFASLNAQNIHIVPNPGAPGMFSWSGSGALSGYAGTPIIFNNSLVLEYNATSTSDLTLIKLQLAVYTGGDSLHLITNPDNGQGVYFQSIQIVFNSKLFFIYLDASGIQRLASFDGTAITLYPNPDASTIGFVGSPRVYNGTLYVAYVNAAGSTQFGTFTGSGISLIPNPDNSTVGFYNDYSAVFNNKICSRYVTAAGPKQLATYNGTSWTLLPNPDATTRGVYPAFPIAYHNKLYFQYYSATNQYQFMEYDGTSNPTLVANPQSSGSNNGGVAGLPIIFSDTLFFQYYNTANVQQLAKFGGASISLVPNPDATTYGFWNTPIIYNNNLYIFYLPVDGTHHLAKYQSTSNSLNVYPNPDAGMGYWDQPIVYGNNLYFIYNNAQSVYQLGYFGGTSLKLITNPSGIYNGSSGNNGYTGYPVVWNNILYMQFGGVPYGNAGNLAFINGSILPITLTNFGVQKNGNTSLLQWNISNEMNNASFIIERSSNGTNFEPIAKVAGHGTIATPQKYQLTDETPFKGLNYYRLKQIDYDGNFTYSNVVTVSFPIIGGVFKIFPNPAINHIDVTVPTYSGISVVIMYDLNAKKILEKQISSNTVSQSIDLTRLASGVYQLTLIQGSEQQTLKMVKQ
ncbi:MAG: T9SS type A sorting domain-containing protein [Ginsengibacter sp.]